MKKTPIYTDVDGVLLNWVDGFRAFLREKNIKVKHGAPDTWDMRNWVEHPDVLSLIKEFNSSWRFGTLQAYPDATNALVNHLEGYRIVAVTSCSDDPEIQRRRKDNLRSEFGPIFDEVICLPLGSDKTEVLKKLEPGIWVEDLAKGAEHGLVAGHRTFLLSRSYNNGDLKTGIERVYDWGDILDRLFEQSV